MKVVVVGATGLVGSTMCRVLEERKFPVSELIPVASERSFGKKIPFAGKEWTVISAAEAIKLKPDVALFSAGAEASHEWAPKFAEGGCTVIDNSSAWRMQETIPLIVPEINGDVLTANDKIIANPNCSTIQMVMVLDPVYKKFGIKRVVVSTYQSVSGSGQKGVNQMMSERNGEKAEKLYPYTIDMNCFPHIDVFLENDYTKEEMKMVNETRKILRAPEIEVSPTTVRVPVKASHSESVNIETEKDFEIDEIKKLLRETEGVIVQDDPKNKIYPMPVCAEGKDEVFVGRIRKDLFHPRAFNCWIVSDNLRKGAATNAVQIAEYLLNHNLI